MKPTCKCSDHPGVGCESCLASIVSPGLHHYREDTAWSAVRFSGGISPPKFLKSLDQSAFAILSGCEACGCAACAGPGVGAVE